MEVPQWLKNIWSRPARNNYAESLVPRGLLNNSGKNLTSNTTQRNLRLNATAPSFVPGTASTASTASRLNASAASFVPASGGRRKRRGSRANRKTRKGRKSRKSRK